MIYRMIFATVVAALLGGYVAMLYAMVHLVVLINQSYLLSLAV